MARFSFSAVLRNGLEKHIAQLERELEQDSGGRARAGVAAARPHAGVTKPRRRSAVEPRACAGAAPSAPPAPQARSK